MDKKIYSHAEMITLCDDARKQGKSPRGICTCSMHTIEEDFDHYLAYSNQHGAESSLKEKLFKAFEASW